MSDDQEPLPITISALENTNFGDHGDMIRRDYPVVPGETVDELVRRVFTKIGARWQSHTYEDVIEIRVVVGGAEPPKEASASKDPWGL